MWWSRPMRRAWPRPSSPEAWRNSDGIALARTPWRPMRGAPQLRGAVAATAVSVMLIGCLAFSMDKLLKEAKRVVIYLYNTRTSLAITYRSSMGGTPVRCNWAQTLGQATDGDSDASFEAGRSTSGYSFMLCDAAIAWGTKKQQSERCVVHVRGQNHGGLHPLLLSRQSTCAAC
eukprot:6212213-Pleurochrysis_carterae.AAC.2